MLFSYNWLQDYIKKKLPKPEKLAELLTMHFAEVEELKKVGQDFVLDIAVKPNRAGDCFSHIGIARECAAILNLEFQAPNFMLKEDGELKAKDFVNIEVEDKKACSRYTARVITDVEIGSSPQWLKERLKVCGLQPINNIVDMANYVMLETGQPLHAFDFDKIGVNPKSQIPNSKQVQNSKFKTKKIIVRFAKKGEKIITLDNKRYDLDKNILVIADVKKPIGVAGIKGELTTGIDKNTKTIVLESANFNPVVIRRGSKQLNLKTDASWRFEHGIDPNFTEMAINRTASLMQEFAGGKIAQGTIDFYPQKNKPKTIILNVKKVEGLLGIKIPSKEIIKILKSLGFKIRSFQSDVLNVKTPTRRLDVSLAEDLIEEIGRIYGYEKIPAILPKSSLAPAERNLEIFWEESVKNTLEKLGFTEVYNYSFINENKARLFGYSPLELFELENPLNINQKYLCPSLIPNLLENVKNNFRYVKEVKIFELAKIFLKSRRVWEKRALTGLIAQKESQEDLFYQAKGVIDVLLEKMGISPSSGSGQGFWYDQHQATPEESRLSIWNLARSAEIKIDHKEAGFLGEISPGVLETLKIKGRIVLFDIDFEVLQKLASEEQEYRPFSPYPAAVRDLAVLVPRGVLTDQVLQKIDSAGGLLVRDVDLFDIYEGEELPEGKKNLAFHIIYQAEDRTLTSKEIDKIHKKIAESLEQNPEWEVRK